MKRTHTKKEMAPPRRGCCGGRRGLFCRLRRELAGADCAGAFGDGAGRSARLVDCAGPRPAAPQEDLPEDAFGERVYPASVTADGQAYHPLAVYADPQGAMDTLLEMPKEGGMLEKISATVGRGALSAGNWKTYAAAVKALRRSARRVGRTVGD